MNLAPLVYFFFLSSVVWLLAAILAFLPRLSAARRHLVWQASFAVVIACSPLAFLNARIALPVLPAEAMPVSQSRETNPAPQRAAEGSRGDKEVLREVSAEAVDPHWKPSGPSLDWAIIVWAIWGLGILVVALRLVFGFSVLHGLMRRSRFVGRADENGYLSLKARAGVPVYASEEIGVPMAVGTITPIIVVPETLLSETADQLRAPLLHELGHAKRSDPGFILLAGLATAIYWFNPLAWFAKRRLRVESEWAADDDAIRGGLSATEYSEGLIAAVRRLKLCDSRLFPISQMAEDSEIGTRLCRLIAETVDRSAPTTKIRVLTIFGAIGVGLMALMIRPVSAQPPVSSTEESTRSTASPSRISDDLKSFSLLITDGDGQVVKGAEVSLSGLRTAADPGSWYGVDENLYGRLGSLSSENGIAGLKYPPYIESELPTSVLCLNITAPGFGRKEVEFAVSDTPATVQLEKAATLILRALGIDGMKGRLAVQFDGTTNGLEIVPLQQDGTTASGEVTPGLVRVRVVFEGDEGGLFFSDVETLDLRPGERKTVDMRMREGTPVKGRLDDSVPRPVKDGWVRALTMEKPYEGGRSLYMTWLAKAPIDADGNFVLPPMPPGQVNILAACDGFVSAQPTDPVFNGQISTGIRVGQALPRKGSITVEMERTGSARVLVLAPDGKPLSGAEVSFWPNESAGFGTTLFGGATPTSEVLGLDSLLDRMKEAGNRFRAVTGFDGIVEIGGLPSGNVSFEVRSPKYVMPFDRTDPSLASRRIGRLKVEAGETSATRVTMVKKGRENQLLPSGPISMEVTLLEVGDEKIAASPEFQMALSDGDLTGAQELLGKSGRSVSISMPTVSSGKTAKGEAKQMFSYPFPAIPSMQMEGKSELLGVELECVPTLFPLSIGLQVNLRSKLLVESGRYPRFRTEEMGLWKDVNDGGTFGFILPWEQGLGPTEEREGFTNKGLRLAVFVKAALVKK